LRKAGETSIVELVVAGKKHPVFIHDILRNPITDEIENVDFYQVRLDQKIRIKVPVVFVGEAPGVKEKSGILVRSLNEIEVEALPNDIPQNIEVDLKVLADIGSSVHVSEVVVGKGVRVLVDPTFVVATVTARMTEEQEAALAAVGDVATVKTEAEEKKAAKEAEAAAGATPEAGAPAKEAAK
jgi:large subunit ribosomal protein L25